MTSSMRFSTALRPHVRNKIEELGHTDIVIGVPSYSSASSIEHVLKTIIKGVKRYYPDRKAFLTAVLRTTQGK
jgi:hypothetical protein